jgi:hypothetical protein
MTGALGSTFNRRKVLGLVRHRRCAGRHSIVVGENVVGRRQSVGDGKRRITKAPELDAVSDCYLRYIRRYGRSSSR